jgi:hypothetical protein
MLDKNRLIFVVSITIGTLILVLSGIFGSKLTFVLANLFFKFLVDKIFPSTLRFPVAQILYGSIIMLTGYICLWFILKKLIKDPDFGVKEKVFMKPIGYFLVHCGVLGLLIGIGNTGLVITLINLINM